ncbi:MAG: hypothetical protein ACPGYT_13300 [Nitrospirales bacterium]
MASQWLHTLFSWLATCWESTRGLFQALTLIRFNILLGIICSLALYTSQGQDVLRALVEVEPWYQNMVPKLCFLIFTVSFALTAWYFARVMFSFTFPKETEEQASYTHVSYTTIKELVTRWLGPIILFMVSGALIKAVRSTEAMDEIPGLQLIAMAIVLVGVGMGMLFFVYYCRGRFRLDNLGMDKNHIFKSFRDLPTAPRVWFLVALFLSVTAFIVFSYQAGVIAPWIGTAGILMLWATTLVAMGGGLVYIGNQYRIPVIGFVIVLVMVFSLFNDNHRVRQTETMRPYEEQAAWTEMTQAILTAMRGISKGITARGISESNDPSIDSFEAYFLAWFKDLEENWREEFHGRHGHDGPVPLVLVSTEGGGIRAAYWTAAVLTELETRSVQLAHEGTIPLNFARHVFSISGVSGGSLGAAVFASIIKEQHHQSLAQLLDTCQLHPKKSIRAIAENILKQDFLSPTVGVLLFPDMFQRFLPVGILDDRALALEQAWERAWFGCTGSERFAKPFDDLWDNKHFEIPLLFLNSTVVETGQRIIMHPIPFTADQDLLPRNHATSIFQEYFNSALDGPGVLGGKVPLSTAVHMSARFTYVSPAGTIFRQDLSQDSLPEELEAEPKVLRVVDGGYFENSGAVTTTEILLAIRKIAKIHELNIRPIVIHISNDPLKQRSRKLENFAGSHAFMPEILSPLWALLNVRPARGYQARDELSNRIEPHTLHDRSQQSEEGSFVHFQLCEFKRRLPLGWMLSELTRQDIDYQLPTIDTSPPDPFKTIAKFNLNNLSVVLDGLSGTYSTSGNTHALLTDYTRDCIEETAPSI